MLINIDNRFLFFLHIMVNKIKEWERLHPNERPFVYVKCFPWLDNKFPRNEQNGTYYVERKVEDLDKPEFKNYFEVLQEVTEVEEIKLTGSKKSKRNAVKRLKKHNRNNKDIQVKSKGDFIEIEKVIERIPIKKTIIEERLIQTGFEPNNQLFEFHFDDEPLTENLMIIQSLPGMIIKTLQHNFEPFTHIVNDDGYHIFRKTTGLLHDLNKYNLSDSEKFNEYICDIELKIKNGFVNTNSRETQTDNEIISNLEIKTPSIMLPFKTKTERMREKRIAREKVTLARRERLKEGKENKPVDIDEDDEESDDIGGFNLADDSDDHDSSSGFSYGSDPDEFQ